MIAKRVWAIMRAKRKRRLNGIQRRMDSDMFKVLTEPWRDNYSLRAVTRLDQRCLWTPAQCKHQAFLCGVMWFPLSLGRGTGSFIVERLKLNERRHEGPETAPRSGAVLHERREEPERSGTDDQGGVHGG